MDRYRMLPSYRYYDVEGTSPLTLDKSVGKPLRDCKIYGNSVQDGTPTPENPVEVQSVGDKSKNLVDMSKVSRGYLNQSGEVLISGELQTSDFIDVSNISNISISSAKSYAFYDEEKVFISSEIKSMTIFRNYTIPENAKYIRFDWQAEKVNGDIVYAFAGSYTEDTFPPYEPYGYKIPIEVGGKNLFDVNGDINRDMNGNPPPNQFHGNYIVSGNQFLIKTSAWATTSFGQFINVEVGKTYTVSLDIIEWGNCPTLEVGAHAINPNANLARVRINASENTMTFSFTATTDTVHIAFAQTGIGYGDNGLIIGNVQVEEGDTATDYEPYKEPIKTDIYLDEPLKNGEYIDFINQRLVKSDTEQPIDLSPILTHKGTNVISVGTEIQPSNMQIQYYK